MIKHKSFDQFAVADHASLGPHWNFLMTCLGIALGGLLVTTTTAGIIAYLLLTRSHL